MKQEQEATVIFQEEEMIKAVIPEDWGPDDSEKLMELRGMALLKDVARVLKMNRFKFNKHYQQLEKTETGSGYRVMGTRKVFSQWMVRLSIFLPYYREHFQNRIRKVQPSWDSNQVLAQKGLFFLVDVCKKLPFTSHQLRYQAGKNADAKDEFGLWKDTSLKRFIVDMEVFAAWVKALHESMSKHPSAPLTSPKRQRMTKSMATLFPHRTEVIR